MLGVAVVLFDFVFLGLDDENDDPFSSTPDSGLGVPLTGCIFADMGCDD